MLLSGHTPATVNIISQKLRLPELGLHKTGSVTSLSKIREGPMRPAELLATGGFWR